MTVDRAAAAQWAERRRHWHAASPAERIARLESAGRANRATVLRTIAHAGLGHVGGDLSVTDILVTLFEGVLRIDPEQPGLPGRDRFILSKGHCAAALYSVLSSCGFFPATRLAHFAGPLSPLNGHPNREKIPGVETNTGPLGHGLPVAVGCATAAQLAGQDWRTYVVLGDGELQEGSNWEAAMYAGHRRLASLTAIVDRNRLQQGASTEATNDLEPLGDKWRAFGWEVITVDGHSHAALLEAFERPRNERPRAVIAQTVKGKGVSFMENGVEWHHKVPGAEQVAAALAELGEA
ncbi:transketolase [Variovorax sp. J22G21]|uniref:transketolase n=1 Tax=Variovorax fucosicus TaxID=3053517 RepID=UPI0025751EC3|nr:MULTISPECIES: transketolase [unclassified Variovorax]MDM0038252.1 transketolase [Variovorax sp. J22R193]MDM0063028.1 transketolase [Variovorax sp. J22G21]